jgi:hypothetical protein
MYIGHVFLCDAGSLKDCIRRKAFSCTSENVEKVREIEVGSTVFLYNMNADTVVGPFTATGSTGPGLEQGSWKEITDINNKSNVRVEWEDLHELTNAREKFSFLEDLEICKLSHFQTQELMDALKNAPLLYIR